MIFYVTSALLIALVAGIGGYVLGLIDGHRRAETKVQRMKLVMNNMYGRFGRVDIREKREIN